MICTHTWSILMYDFWLKFRVFKSFVSHFCVTWGRFDCLIVSFLSVILHFCVILIVVTLVVSTSVQLTAWKKLVSEMTQSLSSWTLNTSHLDRNPSFLNSVSWATGRSSAIKKILLQRSAVVSLLESSLVCGPTWSNSGIVGSRTIMKSSTYSSRCRCSIPG